MTVSGVSRAHISGVSAFTVHAVPLTFDSPSTGYIGKSLDNSLFMRLFTNITSLESCKFKI